MNCSRCCWLSLTILIVSPAFVFAQQGPAAVAVSPITVQPLASGQTFVGTVMPIKKSVIGSAVDGRVADFPVNEGDAVKKGAPLAQLLTETIRLETESARAELDLRKEELAELEAGSRIEDLDQAQARMLSTKAVYEYRKARLKRTESLYQRSAVNEDEFQQIVSETEAAQQSYLEAVAAHALVVAGPRKERIAQARARVAMQQALVEKLQDQIKKHTIISPFDGYVVAEHTEVGQWVRQGELVAEVVALDTVDVQAFVQESQIPFVTVGMSVRVEVPALATDIFTGQVALIVPQADLRSRTFPVKVRLKNTIVGGVPVLKAGMLARVLLPTGPKQESLLVPKDALVLGGPQPVVFVVDMAKGVGETGKARPVPVELGVASGLLIQVKGDVKQGQLVVVRGNERIRPGQDVLIATELAPDATPNANVIQENK